MTALLEQTLDQIGPVDRAMEAKAQQRLDDKCKPNGSLGRLEEVARRVVAMTGDIDPPTEKKIIVTLGGDHGVAAEGVSAFPQAITIEMMTGFAEGGAGVNVLARHAGAEVIAVDVGVNADLTQVPGILHRKIALGTANMAQGPAMTREQAVASIETGIQLVAELKAEGRVHLLGTGEMGIANTTPSAAIAACMTGLDPADVTGRGTGVDDERLRHKTEVVRRAIEVNQPDPDDPVDVLAKVGGLEIGGIAGLVLGGAAHRVPVVVDGFISSAGALIACALCPTAKEYIFVSHNSAEKGHRAVTDKLGQRPLLDLELRLGEGTGAALAFGIIEAGIKILKEMASYK